MADQNNTPKKRWWEWLGIDVAISGIVAAILDHMAKNLGPKALDKLSNLLGEHVTKRYLEDKRAEILDDFRMMQTAQPPVNIDNLIRRHKEAITKLSEDRFVILLCKIIKDNDPTKGRQATLKWLNDMSDDQCGQMLFLLDQDNHIQAFQRWRDRAARIRKDISNSLKNFKQRMSARFGAVGLWIATAAEDTWELLPRFFRWANGSLLRIMLVLLVAAIVFWPLALIIMAILIWFRGRSAADQNDTRQHGIGLFRFISIMIGVILVIGIYFKLVPTWANEKLAHVVIMAIAATFFFWSVRWVRISLFSFIAICTLILCLEGYPVAWAEGKTVWANVTTRGNDDTKAIAKLQKQLAAKDNESARHQKIDEGTSFPSNGATTLPKEEKQPTSGSSVSAEDNNVTTPTALQTPLSPQVAEQECPSLPQPIEYGDFTFVLARCSVRGNQVRLSGNVQYSGPEKTNMYFHPFRAYDNAGNIYVVQNGRFGDSENFGLGHSGQWMYPPTSVPYSVPFSLELGPKNGNIPPATAVTLIMPCSEQLGSQIVLQLAL